MSKRSNIYNESLFLIEDRKFECGGYEIIIRSNANNFRYTISKTVSNTSYCSYFSGDLKSFYVVWGFPEEDLTSYYFRVRRTFGKWYKDCFDKIEEKIKENNE